MAVLRTVTAPATVQASVVTDRVETVAVSTNIRVPIVPARGQFWALVLLEAASLGATALAATSKATCSDGKVTAACADIANRIENITVLANASSVATSIASNPALAHPLLPSTALTILDATSHRQGSFFVLGIPALLVAVVHTMKR